MKQVKEDKLIKYLSIAATLFFVVWGIITIYIGNTDFIFDRFFSAGVCLLVFFIYKKMHLRLSLTVFDLFALLLHHLKLYGNFYLGITFDRIMHFIAVAAIAAMFYQYLYIADEKKSKLKASILSILIAVGIASIMEILEFIGYSFLASWRAFAAVDTFGLVWLFSGHDTTHAIAAAGAVVGVEAITKSFLYFAHERLWEAPLLR